MRFLLDVNVLIALAFPQHSLHDAAHAWFNGQPNRPWATSPLTQAGFLRIASRMCGNSPHAVQQALAGLEHTCQSPNHEFWPVDIDLRALSTPQRARLIGPNQVADMQLLLLAHRNRGQLATFDSGLKELASGTRYANTLVMI